MAPRPANRPPVAATPAHEILFALDAFISQTIDHYIARSYKFIDIGCSEFCPFFVLCLWGSWWCVSPMWKRTWTCP